MQRISHNLHKFTIILANKTFPIFLKIILFKKLVVLITVYIFSSLGQKILKTKIVDIILSYFKNE